VRRGLVLSEVVPNAVGWNYNMLLLLTFLLLMVPAAAGSIAAVNVFVVACPLGSLSALTHIELSNYRTSIIGLMFFIAIGLPKFRN
jgi:hypothetical protein